MKKIALASIVATTSLFATHGDNLMGLGAVARAMGGIGIGTDVGVDTVFKNPAWLTKSEKFKSSFGGTLFMPDVTAKSSMMMDPVSGMRADGQAVTSKADLYIIPEIAITGKSDAGFSYGFGMFGVSGMGVDYRNEPMQRGLGEMTTNFQFMRLIPSFAYQIDNLSIGAGLSISYGALGMSSIMGNPMANIAPEQRGGGVSDDIGLGFQLGAGYQITKELSVGAFYQSKVDMNYENVYDFNMDGAYQNLHLSQAGEYGIGIGYERDNIKFGVEYKKVEWTSVDGYNTFGWDDQSLYAIGGSYKMDKTTFRAGFNYGTSPIDSSFEAASVSGVPFNATQIAYFNLVAFPALTEAHYSMGVGYEISENVDLDLAYVYAPKETVTYTVPDMMGGGIVEASNKQDSVTFSLTYSF